MTLLAASGLRLSEGDTCSLSLLSSLPLPAINIYCFASLSIRMKVLVGLFGGEGCYFSNNLGFVGMCVLYKGCGLGLSVFLVLLLRIPYASNHPRACFCFFDQSPSHVSWRGTLHCSCGRCKRSCRLCLQESYSLSGELRACTQKAEAKPDVRVQRRARSVKIK